MIPNHRTILTEEEAMTIRANCPSLREPAEATPVLLACLERWRQQSDAARAAKAKREEQR